MRYRPIFVKCLCTVLLLATICAFVSIFHLSYAAVINVPQDYPTIQQAIDAASAGDTISVSRRSGESQSVYYERIVINKQLIIVGESRETVIIDGNSAGTVIRIQADNVEIRGFTIRNGGKQYSGIRANSYSYVTIANNTIKANKYGVVLVYSNYNKVVQNLFFNNSAAGVSLSDSIGNNVSDNNVSESAYGIELSSTNSTFVVGNTATDNSYGIYLEYSSDDTVDKNVLLRNRVDGVFPHACQDILVSGNEVSESAYGVQLYNTDTTTVLGNDLSNNSYGVYLAYSGPSNIVENNTISRNDWGVSLYSSSGNILRGNTLSYNTYGVDPVTESYSNLLYHNNFVENVEQVVWNPDCWNTWYNGYPSGGNYWSDYTGADSKSGPNQDQPGSDGIGDTPYTIDPSNQDRYPLMNPWGIFQDIAVISVTPSDLKVYAGQMVYIAVVTKNEGTETEDFTVTVTFENTTLGITGTIGTQMVLDLSPGASRPLTFEWNTTDVQPYIIYTIIADASILPGEVDTSDNRLVDGQIIVKKLGDINGDKRVNIYDAVILCGAYGSSLGNPNYVKDADINSDGKIDILDAIILTSNYTG